MKKVWAKPCILVVPVNGKDVLTSFSGTDTTMQKDIEWDEVGGEVS